MQKRGQGRRSVCTAIERKRSQKAVCGKLSELLTILDQLPVMILLLNREMRVLKANRAAGAFSGSSTEKLVGLSVGDVFGCLHSLDNLKGCGFGSSCNTCIVHTAVLDAFEKKKDRQRFEARLPLGKAKKLKKRDLILSTALLEYSNTNAVLMCAQDITEYRQARNCVETLNNSLLSLGADFENNLKLLTKACGNLLGAAFAAYSRVEDGQPVLVTQWSAKKEHESAYITACDMCQRLAERDIKNGVCVLRNLKDNPFFQDRPDIARSGLQSYASHPVSSFGQIVGFLSVMHTDDFALGESDKGALALFASAIGIEEERRKNEQTIRRRLEFESLVSTISSRFVGAADIGVAIESSLSDIGIFSRPDRAYAVLLDNDKLTMSSTYEWCAEGVSPQVSTLNNLPCSMFSWWMSKLKNHEVVRIQDVSALPEEAKTEKEMLHQQRVKSSLMLPVYVGNQLAGFVGFSNVSARGQWDDYDVALLQLVSEIFGRVLEGQMAKDSLRKSEEKMHAIFESLAEGITVTDLQGNITQVNAASIRMHGYYSAEEVIGKSAFEFLREEERDRAFRNTKRTLREGSLTGVQYTAIRNDGTELPVELSASVMLDNNGNPFGFVWVTKDITDRVEAEEARGRLEAQKMMVEKLKELDRAKNEFVEIVTHELRTPMTPLRSAIELLLEGTYGHLSRNQRELLEMIARNVESVTRFTTEVLSLSRLEAGKYSLHPGQVSLLTSIQPAVDLLKRNAQRNGISVSIDIEPEICAFADPDAVSEVVTNLVSNAIAHCPAVTQLTVSAKLRNDNFVEISVADDGPGIAKEDADRLFEKFYQISRKSGPGYKGTGIGLALCKRLVEAMGGEITVESRLGEGTVFRFVLPTKPAARG